MKDVSGFVVILFGAYLIGLPTMIVAKRPMVERFLEAFAGSARAHYFEQALRIVVGGALVIYAPSMALPALFLTFGWVIMGTTVGLLLMPWTWHRRFAEHAVPLIIRHLKLYAIGSLALGMLVFFGVFGEGR